MYSHALDGSEPYKCLYAKHWISVQNTAQHCNTLCSVLDLCKHGPSLCMSPGRREALCGTSVYILYTDDATQYIMHSIYCILYTAHHTLLKFHFLLNVKYTLYNVQCTLYFAHWRLHLLCEFMFSRFFRVASKSVMMFTLPFFLITPRHDV